MLEEEERREEGWLIQDTRVKRKKIKYPYERFKLYLSKTQDMGEADIVEGVDIEEDMRLRRSPRRCSMEEALHHVLNGAVV